MAFNAQCTGDKATTCPAAAQPPLQELARANAELQEFHRERNAARVGEWLNHASGLSHVRAAAAAAAIPPPLASHPDADGGSTGAVDPGLEAFDLQQTPPVSSVTKPSPRLEPQEPSTAPTPEQHPATPPPAGASAGQPHAGHGGAPNQAGAGPASAAAAELLQTIREECEEQHGVSLPGSLLATGAHMQPGTAGAATNGATDSASATSTSGELHGGFASAVGMLESELLGYKQRVKHLEAELAQALDAQAKVCVCSC